MRKFLVDHNVPKSVSNFLKKRKYDVKLVKDIDVEMQDINVIEFAKKENRIILSNDKDFISLSVQYDMVDMILFDFFSQDSQIRINALKHILQKLDGPFGLIIVQ